EHDPPRPRRGKPHDAPHGGRLAGAVAAEQADHVARAHFQREIEEDVALAVVRLQTLELEQRHQRAGSGFPRYTRCTSALARTSAGAPSASTRPWWSTVIRLATAKTT